MSAHAAGTGIEDAARMLRYRFLEDAAARMDALRIATAHHRDDNAETVLLHLLRGTGPHGLCGIPPVRGRIIRPLLEISRAEIDGYVAEYHLPYVDDETNSETVYTRNRLRLEALPLLEEISPGCTAHIAAAGSLLREEDAHMQAETDVLLPAGKPGEMVLPVPVLKCQDVALRRRLVRTMGQRLGAALTKAQVDAVLSLGSGGTASLPQDIMAVRLPHQLVLRRNPPLPSPLSLHPGEQRWGPWQVTLQKSLTAPLESPDTVILDASAGPLAVASWNGKGRLAVENGSRSIKRIFLDCGIPVEQRRKYPVLYAGDKPAAIVGAAVDWNLRPQAGQPVWIVTFKNDIKENEYG